MDGWTYIAGLNVAMSGTVIVAVKMIVNSAVKRFEKQADLEREDRIRTVADLWGAFNDHGHKGLDSNGSMVTRR